MERPALQPFAALVFGLFLVQLFSPVVAAQSFAAPTPTAEPARPTVVGSSCALYGMTREEVLKWWQTFGESAFQAEEVNALKQDALQQNQPGNVSVTVNVYPQTKGYANLTDVAAILGLNANDAAKALGGGAAADNVITYAQAEALAKSAGKQPSLIDSLFGKTLTVSAAAREPWEGYKIRLPSGKDLSLKEVYNLYPLSSDECMLDAQDIQGRVEYVALLNKDLTYGYQRSTTTTGEGQHFTAAESDAALSLNGGANTLIPATFQNWLSFVKSWNSIDMWVSVGVGMVTAAGKANADKEVAKFKKDYPIEQQQIDETRRATDLGQLTDAKKQVSTVLDTPRLQHVYTDQFDDPTGNMTDIAKLSAVTSFAKKLEDVLPTKVDATAGQNVASIITGNKDQLRQGLETAFGAGAVPADLDALLKKGSLTPDEAAKFVSTWNDLKTATPALNDLDALVPKFDKTTVTKLGNDYWSVAVHDKLMAGDKITGQELYKIGITDVPNDPSITFNPPAEFKTETKIADGIAATTGKAETDRLAREAQIKELTAKADQMEQAYQGARKRLQTSILVGGLWLGPARFAFSINSAILFQLRATGVEDKYLKLYINKADLAGDFRRATNTLGSGTLLELLADATGGSTPRKAFTVGEVMLFNSGQEQQTGSRTALLEGAIQTQWKGKSEATNFEDLRGLQASEYTSMGFESNLLPPDAVIQNKKEYETYTYAASLLAPLILVRNLKDVGGTLFTLVPFLAAEDLALQVSPSEFAKGRCDPDVLAGYKRSYIAATTAGWVVNYAPTFKLMQTYLGGLTSIVNKIGSLKLTKYIEVGKVASVSRTVLDKTNLFIALQWYYGSEALRYVTTCKDSKYTILSYQQLAAPKAELSGKLKSVTDLGKNLNIGDLFKGIGQKTDLTSMPEVLNLRTVMRDQYGFVKPRELYYFHLDGGNTQWHGAFARKPDCFQQNLQNKDGTAATLNRAGVVVRDKNGVVKAEFKGTEWSRRALLAQLRQDLARQIVPNKLISTLLDCSKSVTAFEVQSNGHLFTGSPTCTAVACLQDKLSELTGKSVGEDLSTVLGPVQRVYTSEGIATIENGFARFTRTSSKTTGGVLGVGETTYPTGSEVQAPSITTEGTGTTRQASSILIQGDGTVKLRGQLSTDKVEEEEIGTLYTLITASARMEFDPGTKELHLALYILDEVRGTQVKGIDTSLVKNKDGSTGIAIQNLQPATGEEKTVKEFEKSVKKLQGDGGFQQFDTANKTYIFTTDENGNPILKIVDKATGQVETLKLTGPVTRDPVTGDIVVPTEKGEYRFKIDMQNGQPMLTTTDPNGLKEIAMLLAARTQNGILVFDPQTGKWQVLNGQDIPMNPDFANKGLSLLGSSDGARGVASEGLLSMPKSSGREAAGLSAFASLPSWPTELPLLLLALLSILAGTLFIRSRGRRA